MSGFSVRSPFGAGPGTNPIFQPMMQKGFPTIYCSGIARNMERPDPKARDRALAIEYWIATILISGAFVAGLIGGLTSLIGG